jgi:50S ribosomal protein L16 3-hydroxylase
MSGAAGYSAAHTAARPAAPLRRLGALPVGEFVARYWQQRALCIRQLLAGFASPVGAEALFALAADPDVESRLVTRRGGRCQLRHGPFEAADLPPRRRADWTLLVQGVDLHDAAVAALAARFRFLPAARFDDVMISFATDGGGVGPHVDQYDVFLLQAQGRRRWRIARDFDPALVEGLPLKVLANFRHEQEWILEPGDALYLPPGVAHEGVAVGECLTISIGFRLPPWQEVVDAWQDRQARLLSETGTPDARVPDATRRPTAAPARLPAGMVEAVARELRRLAPSRREAGRTLLEHLTEPKPSVVFDAPRPALGLARFCAAAARRGIRLDLRSRMLFQGADIAINGELAPATRAMGPLLRRLANQGGLEGGAWAAPASGRGHADNAALLGLLHLWYRAGWLHIAAL